MKFDAKKLARKPNIAIVISRFNEDVTGKLYHGCIERFKEFGIEEDDLTIAWVPGAVEIPIVLQRLVVGDNFDVVIALGCVIRGETAHFDYVCEQVSNGCQQVALTYDVPVIFEVVATDTRELALARATPERNKGREAADAALHMASVIEQIDTHYGDMVFEEMYEGVVEEEVEPETVQ